MKPGEIAYEVLAAIEANAAAYGYGDVPVNLILAQAALETGGFTSRRVREDFNAFGMMYPRSRQTLAIAEAPPEPGQPGAFARYESIADSVLDYFLRQQYFDIPNTSNVEAYVDATVESGYATGTGYRTAWLDQYGYIEEGPDEELIDETEYVDAGPVESGANAGWLLFLLALVGSKALR